MTATLKNLIDALPHEKNAPGEPEATQEQLREIFADLLKDMPEAWHHENEILTRTGARRLVRWNNSVLRGSTGEVIGTASIGVDLGYAGEKYGVASTAGKRHVNRALQACWLPPADLRHAHRARAQLARTIARCAPPMRPAVLLASLP